MSNLQAHMCASMRETLRIGSYMHGWRLREDRGNGPPKIWGGERTMHPSSPIFREVLLLKAKCELA